jgi:hypothetical protein
MALQFVALDAQDATGATNTALIKAALLASNTGIQLPPGSYNVRALSGVVAPMPAGKEIAGAYVSLGVTPTTRLFLVGSDSTTANVVTVEASGVALGITVRNLYIDGGRAGGWATASYIGACVGLSGQSDYASPHNVLVENCHLVDGLTQQLYFNSINTGVISYVKTWATLGPVQAAHGVDFDAVADNKRSKFITISDCDLDSYGQESLKMENSSDFTISRTLFRQYVTLVQDVSPYDELGRITFDGCWFDAHVTLNKLKITLGGGTGGDGTVTWKRCTFTDNGLIYCSDSTVANYGTMTVTDCVFSQNGNSFKFPVGVTVVSSGNLFAELPTKRFARPAVDPTIGAGLSDPGTGPNAYMARRTTTTSINAAVTASANGEEVWALNGTYVGAAGGANRSINCGGKTITLRAESKFGVVLDESAASGYAGFNQSADVAGHLIWGFVVYGAGIPGGNGAGATITAGDSYMRSMAFIACSSGNNGAGLRITTTGTVVIEDYLVANCTNTTNQGAVYVSQSSPVGTITLLRGRVLNNTHTGTGVAGVRLENANTTVRGLEVVGNVSSGGVGGVSASRAATVTNLTAAGNTGGATAHDVSVANGITLTGDSWVCWGANGAIKPVSNLTTGILILDKATINGGASAGQFGNATGANAWTNILTTDPQFVDATGGNYQLKPESLSRGVGVQRADMADGFGQPFAYSAASANHGAWA